VTDIHRVIQNVIIFTLEPEDPTSFSFTQEQYLIFPQNSGGVHLRRA
jgi:ferredoxin-NADP reductase